MEQFIIVQTLAAFKDVILKIDYLSKTNTLLKTQKKPIFEFVYPNKSVSYSWRISDAPNGTSKFRITIVSAKTN